MADRLIVIAYDGSPGSDHAIREAAEVLAPRRALVVVVWKQGLATDLLLGAPTAVGLPPAELDIRIALEVDEKLYEAAQRMGEQGAAIAREAGLQAESLVVAEDPDVSVAESIVGVADRRDAQAIVIAQRGRGGPGGVMLGGTIRDVLRRSTVPVVVVRAIAG